VPVILSQRNPDLMEIMDDPACSREGLNRTYRAFGRMNRMLSQWGRIYRDDIRPFVLKSKRTVTILDIGTGGGDLPRYLSHLAQQDNLSLQITAIDPDERAIRFAKANTDAQNIEYMQAGSGKMAGNEERFDFVISNHLLHHLAENDILRLCRDAQRLALRKVIFNDIERGDLAWILFSAAAPLLYPNTFIPTDGPLSIRRSFTKNELQKLLPGGWKVKRLFPYRLIAAYDVIR